MKSGDLVKVKILHRKKECWATVKAYFQTWSIAVDKEGKIIPIAIVLVNEEFYSVAIEKLRYKAEFRERGGV